MVKLLASNINKTIKQNTILSEVSIEVQQGEIIGLLGPNGAGKTTLFYIIAGLIPPTKGTILLENKDVTSFSLSQRASMGLGYLPQESSIFRRLSVYDNLYGVIELNQNIKSNLRHAKTMELLEQFKIENIRKTKGYELSGGERRRVEIARALASEPSFLLLDEPFSGIDPISVMELQETILNLKKIGIGILITDHNVRETLKICDRSSIICNGQVLAEGLPQEILQNPKVKEVYLGNSFISQ
ncbi:MAG: LPS export ABC transporter ATP-binding protein [Gammaproteobacteria bacterium]|jgi:lipopolysaccharide export system ATP-binding protein